MLQQQRKHSSTTSSQQGRYQSSQSRVRSGGGGGGGSGKPVLSNGNSSVVGQANDVMTRSTCSRRAELGQSYYQDAKKNLAQALSSDESGETMDALDLYNQALSTIRSGLAVLRSSVGEEPAADSALHDIKAKMENLKDQIKARMEDLLDQEAESRRAAHHAANLTTSHTQNRSQCAGSVAHVEEGPSSDEKAAADLLFHMDRGIGLFEVDKKDHVMRFDDVDAVSVFKYREQVPGQPPAFLQCGGFICPLIPGTTPVLKTSDKMYMFPDFRKEDGNCVGISLETTSGTQLAELDSLLSELALFKTTEEVNKMASSCRKENGRAGITSTSTKAEPTWGTTVAGGIDRGVNWVSSKIAQGTEIAGNLVIKGASKLREHIEPEEKPTEVPVPVEKGVHYTRRATGGVVRVSNFLMTSLAKLTVKAGTGVKNIVQESEFVKSREVNPHAKEAWKATKSGVKGAASVFTDLKAGASAVVRSAGRETSRTVGHKYGEQAGKVADDAVVATGNTVGLAYTYWSWKTWGISLLGKIGEVVTTKEQDRHSQDNTYSVQDPVKS